jgi:Family of unknown function (DUF6228)
MDSPIIVIHSARDGVFLELSRFMGPGSSADSDSFHVRLTGHDFKAEAGVSAFMAPSLGNFFDSLADEWTGWQGKKVWSSLEGEFTLTATSDSTGHVTLAYFLRPPYTGFHWELRGALEIEAGQLAAIARDVRAACGGVAGMG